MLPQPIRLHQPAESFRDFLSGYVGGVAGIVVGHPIDSVKVRLQLLQCARSSKPLYDNALCLAKRMVDSEGIFSLFRGMLSPVMGLAGLNSILFMSYGQAKRMLENRVSRPDGKLSLSDVFIAGSIAGVSCTVITTPTELVKCRLQATARASPSASHSSSSLHYSPSSSNSFSTLSSASSLKPSSSSSSTASKSISSISSSSSSSSFSSSTSRSSHLSPTLAGSAMSINSVRSWAASAASSIKQASIAQVSGWMRFASSTPQEVTGSVTLARSILQTEGVRGFYRGNNITLLRDGPGYGVYFACYEASTRMLVPSQGPASNHALEYMFAGGLAGAVSWAAVYPIDVIKSRFQADISMRYTSAWQCAVEAWRNEGIKPFFRGITPTLVRAFPVNAITFYVIEILNEALSQPAGLLLAHSMQ